MIEICKSLNISKYKFTKTKTKKQKKKKTKKRINEIKDSDNNNLKRERILLKQQTNQYYENQLEAA